MTSEKGGAEGRFRSGWLGILLSLLWGMTVFIAYYVVHKPVTIGLVISLARLALILLGWLGTLSLAYLIGQVIRPFLQHQPQRTALALRLGFGLAILGYFVLVLGAVRGYWPLLGWTVTAIALAFGLPALLADMRMALPTFPTSRAKQALACFALFMLLTSLLLALGPPTAWDSLVYQLTGPRMYLEAGGLVHDVDLPFLGFPQAGSMLFLWGQLLVGPELAQLLHLTFAVLTLVLMTDLAKVLAPGTTWLTPALILGVPSAAMLMSWAYVEWIVMYAALASFTLLHVKESPGGGRRIAIFKGREALILAGFFAGMAFNVKYTAIGVLLGLILVMIFEHRSWRASGIFLGVVVFSILPYLLKNAVLTGNPVYPFFFDGMYWDAHRAFWYARVGTGLNLVQLLLAPWEATIFGMEGGVVLGHPPYSATIGPALLALLPLAAIGYKERREESKRLLRSLAIVCLVAFVAWLVQLGLSELLVQTRLLFPILPMLVLLAAAGFEGLKKRGRAIHLVRLSFGTLIGIMLVLNVLEVSVSIVDTSPARVLLARQTESEYLAERLGEYAYVMADLNQLPEGSVVRFLWEPRSFHCARHVRCEPDAILDRWWHTWQHETDETVIAETWRDEGVTHVLIFHAGRQAVREEGFDPLTAEAWSGLDTFIDQHLFKLSVRQGGYALYALIE
jgi:hypothetical protein